jgi:hypothetical protein
LRYILKEAIRTQLHDSKDPARVKAKWLASIVAIMMMIVAPLCTPAGVANVVDKKGKIVKQEFFVDGLNYALRKMAGVAVVFPVNSTGFVQTGAQFSYPSTDCFWTPLSFLRTI